ncbi:MAG: DUF427 domain-containing protein [Nannocystaceae bacterium]|nr:DUF427 domain-containing protein [Nannocystaceae bacterium]
MARASWNGTLLAESDTTVVVEGNHYFPADSLKQEHFKASNHQSHCPWKGDATYYNLEVGDQVNENAAWTYPEPKTAASEIKDHVAFWKGVQVET